MISPQARVIALDSILLTLFLPIPIALGGNSKNAEEYVTYCRVREKEEPAKEKKKQKLTA